MRVRTSMRVRPTDFLGTGSFYMANNLDTDLASVDMYWVLYIM
jgi:hypothetical protein